VRASLLQTSFSRGTCKSQTRTKSRPGPRALSLLCPRDGEPPMCTPCIYKPWALNLHRWEAPAGTLILGWSEVPGRAGPKRPVPGYRPFRGPYFVPKRPVRGLPAVCRRGPLNIALFTRQLFNPGPAWAPINRQRLSCPQATLCRCRLGKEMQSSGLRGPARAKVTLQLTSWAAARRGHFRGPCALHQPSHLAKGTRTCLGKLPWPSPMTIVGIRPWRPGWTQI